jgi:hypothetical protein
MPRSQKMKIFLTVLTLCSGAYGASVVNSHPTSPVRAYATPTQQAKAKEEPQTVQVVYFPWSVCFIEKGTTVTEDNYQNVAHRCFVKRKEAIKLMKPTN